MTSDCNYSSHAEWTTFDCGIKHKVGEYRRGIIAGAVCVQSQVANQDREVLNWTVLLPTSQPLVKRIQHLEMSQNCSGDNKDSNTILWFYVTHAMDSKVNKGRDSKT